MATMGIRWQQAVIEFPIYRTILRIMKNMKTAKSTDQLPAENISRRRFLAATGAVTAFMALPRHVALGAGESSPNNKLNIAGVGIGGQGASDLNDVSTENIVALCDVDWDYAAHTFKKYPDAKRYKDFREMLDKEKNIDAVVVGTPDHNHAIVSITAIKHGKHVYCEKPLTRTVYEARAVAKAAREAKVASSPPATSPPPACALNDLCHGRLGRVFHFHIRQFHIGRAHRIPDGDFYSRAPLAEFLRDLLRFASRAVHQKKLRDFVRPELERRRPPCSTCAQQQNFRALQIEAQFLSQRARNRVRVSIESV